MQQTARDYLIKANLAKPGRGKFSNEAKEYLYEAIANGHKFSDWDENGRINVPPSVKNRIEKRAETTDAPANFRPKLNTYKRYRKETQIVLTHPTKDQVVVLDTLGGKPIWAVEKIVPPAFLKEYTWTLR